MKEVIFKLRIHYDEYEACDTGLYKVYLPNGMTQDDLINKITQIHEKLSEYFYDLSDNRPKSDYDAYELNGRNPNTLMEYASKKLNFKFQSIEYDQYILL